MMSWRHVRIGMNGVCGAVALHHAVAVRLSVDASAQVETKTIAKASSWRFASAMNLNVPDSVSGKSGHRAQCHAVVVVNGNAIAFARLATSKIVLARPPKANRAAMTTVPCLASGVCGAVAPRPAVVVVRDHVVDSVQLVALLTAWVILKTLSHAAKRRVPSTWNGLSGLIARVHVVETDVAPVIDFARLVVLWTVLVKDCPAKVINVPRSRVPSGNSGHSGSHAVLPVVSVQLTASDNAQLESWPTVSVIQFNKSPVSTQFVLLTRLVQLLQCLKSRIVLRP